MSVETRPVPVHIMRWPKIRDLVSQQKSIYAFLYFNSDTSACGCYLLGIDSSAADLGITGSIVEDALHEFVRRGLVERDTETGEILVVDWPRWHRFETTAARGALWASIHKIQSRKLWITIKKTYETIPEPAKGKDKDKVKASSIEEESNNRPIPTSTSPKNNFSASSKNIKNQTPGPSRTLMGIKCWTEDDQKDAIFLQTKYGIQKVTDAVKQLESDDIDPLPSRVKSQLQGRLTRLSLPSSWWSTGQGTVDAGKILKLDSPRGESMESFRQRIRDRIASEKFQS